MHYDPYNGHFWGEFWLEAIDPCHRPLEEYKKKWLDAQKQGENAPFFLWLESNIVSAHHKRIDYLQGDDLENAKIFVQNGVLMKKIADGQLLKLTTNPEKEALFVINQEENMFMVYGEANYRHISLSHGQAVISAGEFKVVDGKVTELYTNSGHYLPSVAAAKQMIDCFKNAGVILDDDTKLKYFSKNQVVKTTVKEFMDGYIEKNPKPPSPKYGL